ncbi:MAG: hypothetical protein AB7P18_17040 [Candidatus Binatia bacterium]
MSCSNAPIDSTLSRHTYDSLVYMANVDKLFVFSGSLACSLGDFGQDTWTFRFASNQWER